MQDKRIFRDVFNFFTKYRDQMGLTDRETFWLSASEELGQISKNFGGTAFVTDLLAAVYQELMRRDDERKTQGQRGGA